MKTAKTILRKYFDADNSVDENAIIKAMKEYAIDVAKEALRNAAGNVSMKMKENAYDIDLMDDIMEIDKGSILSETNIPKL